MEASRPTSYRQLHRAGPPVPSRCRSWSRTSSSRSCPPSLCFVFALFLLDQWLERRRPYQLIWTLGMVWYGIAAGTEFLGESFGWSEPLYRAWYLFGAVYVAAWLGLGTMYLLGKTRFGYAAAFSVLLAGVFTVLSQARQQYPDAGVIPYAAFAIALVGAVLIAIETLPGHGPLGPDRGRADHRRVDRRRADRRSSRRSPRRATRSMRPGSRSGPRCRAPSGCSRPLFNITGGFALVFGALFSVLVAIRDRRFDSRVPATILIAIGGFVPSMTSGLTRFGVTETFYRRRAPGRRLPVRGLPRVDRGLPRDPCPVHAPRPVRAARDRVAAAPACPAGGRSLSRPPGPRCVVERAGHGDARRLPGVPPGWAGRARTRGRRPPPGRAAAP